MEETEAESIEYVASGKNNENHKLGKIMKNHIGRGLQHIEGS